MRTSVLSGTLSTDLVEREPPLECCCVCLSATGSLLTAPLGQPNQDGTIRCDKLSKRPLVRRAGVPAVAETLSAIRDGVPSSISVRFLAAKPAASPTPSSGCSGGASPPTITAASEQTLSFNADAQIRNGIYFDQLILHRRLSISAAGRWRYKSGVSDDAIAYATQ